MTVDGREVPVSEFKYLYQKNNQQQETPMSVEDYLGLFEIYKLKVADALRAGIDTTSSFKREMAQYKRELATPYMVDSAFIYSLVDESFQRSHYDVEGSHIMIYKSNDEYLNSKNRQMLDSIRNEILKGEDFGTLAQRYSQDKTAPMNRGYMGYVTAGKFPYNFEKALFELSEGEISDIVESPVGYHIIKAGKKKPAKGKVLAAHIMKMTPQNSTEEQLTRAKESIDSIYQIVASNPLLFNEIALKESDDKGSARNGGLLPEFGTGEMVPEFEAVAFSLSDGEISQPLKSRFGWHIIKKIGHKDTIPYEEVKNQVLRAINNPQDERFNIVKNHDNGNIERRHNAKYNSEVQEKIKNAITFNPTDSVYEIGEVIFGLSDLDLYQIDGKPVKVKDIYPKLKKYKYSDKGKVEFLVLNELSKSYGDDLLEAEEERLYLEEEDYRNLMNEYSEGSLLYEISVQKVWDKASKDEDGLQKFFESNRQNYSWKEPHAKGILVNTGNDSLLNVIRERMDMLPNDSIIPVIKKEFAGKVFIEKVLVPKGANKLVDNLMFGAEKVEVKGPNSGSYFLYNGKILQNPEELSDVRSQVTGDYQKALEKAWIEELKSKYKVKLNKKEIKKLEG